LRYLTLEVPGAPNALTWQNIATAAQVVVRYVGLLIFPHSQTIIPPIYPIDTATDTRLIVAIVTLVGLTALAWAVRRRAPLVTFGLTWFALALAPSSILGVLAQTGSLMAEHRVYLASCGFFLAIAALVVPSMYENEKQWPLVVPRAVGAASVLGILLLLTIQRNRVWADPIRLWEEAARLAPDTPAAQLGLAQAYSMNGQCDAAQKPFSSTLELSPVSTDAYLGLADCFLRRNELQEAALILRKGESNVPDNEIRILLALASLEESAFHRPAEALQLCNQALLKQPSSIPAQDCVRRNRQNVAGAEH
jgi:tetratricopeptide (TPR) repeat protein